MAGTPPHSSAAKTGPPPHRWPSCRQAVVFLIIEGSASAQSAEAHLTESQQKLTLLLDCPQSPAIVSLVDRDSSSGKIPKTTEYWTSVLPARTPAALQARVYTHGLQPNRSPPFAITVTPPQNHTKTEGFEAKHQCFPSTCHFDSKAIMYHRSRYSLLGTTLIVNPNRVPVQLC